MTRRAVGPWYEAAFGEHYPDLYAHRDEAEARRCLDLLPRLAPLGPAPVLDLGCGQGRHLAPLAAAGLAPVGLDLSWALLRRARADSADQPLLRGDMRRLPLRSTSVGSVLSLFTAFGYFGAAADHEPVVREVARVLRPGGHWFLDFLDSERVAAELAAGPRFRRRETELLRVEETRRLAAGPRRVVKTVVLRPLTGAEADAAAVGVPAEGLRYEEDVTLFTLDDLDGLASAAGLVRVAAAGSYDGAPLAVGSSDRWLLVYRRPTPAEEVS